METQQTSRWPLAPLIIPPTSNNHKSTFIVLHGRGSTADKFASPLLTHLVSSPHSSSSKTEQTETTPSFQSFFPNSKFIFPTARLLRARAYNRSLTHQWFDNYPLDAYEPDHKAHVQAPGLREAVRYVHELLKDAIQEVGAQNVVLMGLSQGCATTLTSMLLWEGEKLGAVVGMCGYLPYMRPLGEAIAPHDENGDYGDDVFERSAEDDDETRTAIEIAIEHLRAELDLPNTRANEDTVNDANEHRRPLEIPVFLGHGVNDDKVPFKYGKELATLLQKMGIGVKWKEYEGLGHWYSADMLRDVVTFLQHSQPNI